MDRRIAVALTASLVGGALALGPVSAYPEKAPKVQKTQKAQLQAQKRGQGGGLKMIQALNLSAAQQAKIKAIRTGQKQQMMALKSNTSLTPEQRRARARSLRADSQAKIQQVLTPAQKQKLASLRTEQRAQRKKLAAQRVQKQASAGTAKVK